MRKLSRREVLIGGAAAAANVAALRVSGMVSAAGPVTYPDIRRIERPDLELRISAWFDVFHPPVATMTVPAGAPQIAEWNRTAGPDESLVVTGENFTPDTQFVVSGPHGQVAGVAKVQMRGDRMRIITLPEKLPAWGTYLLWARNAAGCSYPVLLNSTSAFWLGPDKAVVGDTVAVHGTNLAHANRPGKSNARVYLLPAGDKGQLAPTSVNRRGKRTLRPRRPSRGQWVTPTSVNPYRVQFAVPELPLGIYEVWVHNGHGGEYGWSRSPNDLTIYEGPGWTETWYRVTDYGATGNGSTDDTDAIMSAIAHANEDPGSTVYFPAGTYRVSRTLRMGSRTRWVGEGMDKSVIVPHGSYLHQIDATGLNTIEIQDLGLDMSHMVARSPVLGQVYMRGINPAGSSNVWFTRIKVAATIYGMVMGSPWSNDGILDCSYVYINDSVFSFYSASGPRDSRQLFFDGNTFLGGDHGVAPGNPGALYCHTLREASFTNNKAMDLQPGVGTGTLRRFIVHQSYGQNPAGGGHLNEYIANNTATKVGPIPNFSDPNSGEIILWETGASNHAIAGASATTVRLVTPAHPGSNSALYIYEGKGLGQIRLISAYDPSTATITVDREWNVQPDASSKVQVYTGPIHTVTYSNDLNGKRGVYPDFNTGARGVDLFEGGLQSIIADNRISDVQFGVGLWCENEDVNAPTANPAAQAFQLVTGNEIAGSQAGIQIINGVNVASSASNSLGVVARGNRIHDCIDAFSTVNDQQTVHGGTGGLLPGSIIEKNEALNVNVGANLHVAKAGVQTNFLIRNNRMDAGTRARGSIAVDFDGGPHQEDVLVGNTWLNFQTLYGGAPQG